MILLYYVYDFSGLMLFSFIFYHTISLSLGKKQADYVGRRLKELGFNYTKIRHSTMTRAKETSEIISKHFPDIPSKSDDLLRENRAIPPEPPCGSYQPEYKASIYWHFIYVFLSE